MALRASGCLRIVDMRELGGPDTPTLGAPVFMPIVDRVEPAVKELDSAFSAEIPHEIEAEPARMPVL